MRYKLRLAETMLLAAMAACYKTEYSATLEEPGTVEQVSFIPGATVSGSGISSSGSAVFTTNTIPDRYVVTFACKHGKFTLNPESEIARMMWKKLHQGAAVTIRYQEVYHVKDGVTTLYDLHFLDAR